MNCVLFGPISMHSTNCIWRTK